MPIELEVNFPGYEKGIEMDVGGVLVKNGGTTKLSDEQEETFAAFHRATPKDHFEGSKHVKVRGSGKLTASEVEKRFPVPEPITGENPYLSDKSDEGGES